jgi:hypothetical protein
MLSGHLYLKIKVSIINPKDVLFQDVSQRATSINLKGVFYLHCPCQFPVGCKNDRVSTLNLQQSLHPLWHSFRAQFKIIICVLSAGPLGIFKSITSWTRKIYRLKTITQPEIMTIHPQLYRSDKAVRMILPPKVFTTSGKKRRKNGFSFYLSPGLAVLFWMKPF